MAMRQVMEDVMAKVIEFYVPDSFSKKADYAARSQRGKLVEFPLPKGIQPNSDYARWQGLAYMASFALNVANDHVSGSV